ncbi:MAG TPA: MDR family MFS transporter [Candidatus Dormibacteraeota bacterium]
MSLTAARPTAAAQPAVVSARYRWAASGIIALGSVASILSSTTVNVAVPTLEKVFHATLTDIQWVATAYLLGLAAVIPISGWVSDRFGTKRVYLFTLAVFVVTSLLCGFARTVETEIAFRILQGLAGGMVMPVGMSMLMHITPPHERGRMMGTVGVPMLLAPALGPTVAGWLIQNFSWEYIFWINIPFGLIAIVLAWFWLRDSIRVEPGPLDLVGLLLCTPGVTVFIFGVTQASVYGWGSGAALLPMAAGVGLTALFVAWELRQPRPLLELGVFRDAAFSAAILVGVLLAGGMFGATFIVPVFLQQVQGYSALSAGVVLAAQGLGTIVALPISGWLTDRYGARVVVFSGICMLVVVSFAMATVGPDTSSGEWAALLAGRGLAVGFSMMPAFSAAYVTIEPRLISRATALANTAQRMASSLGIAVIATITADRVAAHLPAVSPQMLIGEGAKRHIVQQAVAQGFDQALLVTGGMSMVALGATMLLRRPLASGPGSAHPPLAAPLRRLAVVLSVFGLLGLALSIVLGFNLL